MTTWEYKIVDSADVPADSHGKMQSFRLHAGGQRTRDAIEAYLNGLGAEGWEIISMSFPDTDTGESFVGLAKRALR